MKTLAGLKRAGIGAALSLLVFLAAPAAIANGLTVIHHFNGDDGAEPKGRLLVGQDGRLYGTTHSGASENYGTIFALNPDGSDFNVIRELGDGAIGVRPQAGLIQRADGKLYGLTQATLFRIGTDGAGGELLHSFDFSSDGATLTKQLFEGSDGRLYGTAEMGGPYVFGGTVFAFDPIGDLFSVLITFGGSTTVTSNPRTFLIEGPDGRLYGTSQNGGPQGMGTVFAIAKDGTGLTQVHGFATGEGMRPGAGLLLASDGRFYGTTSNYGGDDVIFGLNTDGTDFAVLHRLNATIEGFRANALVQGLDGRLYGTCAMGGPYSWGTVFAINTDGTGFEVIHFMDGINDGGWPEDGLTVGSDGRLFGVNSLFGTGENGTVFAIAIEENAAPEVAVRSPLFARVATYGAVYLAATHAPTSFTFEGLPAWMSYNEEYRFLSGVPDAMGDFTFTVTATNYHGSGSKEIVVKVGKRLAQVNMIASDQPYDGTPKWATVTTDPEGLAVVVTYNGSATPPTEIGTYTVVATIDDPTHEGTTQRTMKILDPEVIAPFITAQPENRDAELGKPTTFTVVAVGAAPLAYQWRKNYVNIPGANSASYTIESASAEDEGDYYVEVTNSLGQRGSTLATLRVFPSPSIAEQPIMKTAVIGGTVSFSVAASGTGPFTYQWRRNGVDIAGATDAVLTLSGVTTGHSGNYSVVVSNPAASVTSTAAALTIDMTPRLINVSCRAFAGAGDDTLVMGFYISGSGEKTLLIRGIGPRLSFYGVPSVVTDPMISVYKGQDLIDGINDWDASLASVFSQVGAFELLPGSKDAAMTITLLPGLYTVHLVNDGPVAEGVIEVYDISRDIGSRLTNVSCRLDMQPGQTVILGTALIGSPVPVLARGVGPGIAAYLQNPADALADPHLRLYRGDDVVALNDDWELATRAWFVPTGAFDLPNDSKDAAIRVPFSPGGYTVHATGNGGSGVAIIELYESQ